MGGIVGLQGKIGNIPALLAGDAAGLANPITGAGISSATTSGRMAGEAAAAWLKGEPDALDDYAEEVSDLFGPSLRLALKRQVRKMGSGSFFWGKWGQVHFSGGKMNLTPFS